MEIEFKKKIVHSEDLKEYIFLARQNLISLSSMLFFNISNNKIEIKNGEIIVNTSEKSFHENFLELILKKIWTEDDIKEILGYLSIMNLIKSIKSKNKYEINEGVYACVSSILSSYKTAYISIDKINKYKENIRKYNRLSKIEKISIAIGETEYIEKVQSPYGNVSPLKVNRIERIFEIKNPLDFLINIHLGSDLHSDETTVIFRQMDFLYQANVAFKGHKNESKMMDSSLEHNGFKFRVAIIPVLGDKTINVLRILSPNKPVNIKSLV